MAEEEDESRIDLKGHCLLCFKARERFESGRGAGRGSGLEDDGGGRDGNPEDACKRFLKLICRHLDIPDAKLCVSPTGTFEDSKVIARKWENLLKGGVCKECAEVVGSFCDTQMQIDLLRMQLDWRVHEIEKVICHADQDIFSRADRRKLEIKLESEGVNPQSTLQLLNNLRAEILDRACRKPKNPTVVLRRMEVVDLGDVGKIRVDAEKGVGMKIVKVEQAGGPANVNAKDRRRNVVKDITTTRFYQRLLEKKRNQREKSSTNDCSLSSKSMLPEISSTCGEGSSTQISQKGGGSKIPAHSNTLELIRVDNIDVNLEPIFETRAKGDKIVLGYKLKEPGVANSVAAGGAQKLDMSAGINTQNVAPDRPPSANVARVEPTIRNCSATSTTLSVQDLIESAVVQAYSSSSDVRNTTMTKEVAGNSKGTTDRNKPRGRYLKRNFLCPYCTKKYSSSDALDVHLQGHISHCCHFCEKTFSGSINGKCDGLRACKNLALHELATHELKGKLSLKGLFELKSVKCPRCTVTLTSVNQYRSHFYKVHIGVKVPNWKCSECNFVFMNKHSLIRHAEQIHANNRAISESGNVPRDTDSNNSNNAISTPDGDNVASNNISPKTELDKCECSICHEQCSTTNSLAAHYRTHDPSIITCPNCPRFFSNTELLQDHRLRFHLKFKLHRCSKCERVFKTPATFQKHNQLTCRKPRKLRKRKRQRCSAIASASFAPMINMSVEVDTQEAKESKSLADRVKLRRRKDSEKLSKPHQEEAGDGEGNENQGELSRRKRKGASGHKKRDKSPESHGAKIRKLTECDKLKRKERKAAEFATEGENMVDGDESTSQSLDTGPGPREDIGLSTSNTTPVSRESKVENRVSGCVQTEVSSHDSSNTVILNRKSNTEDVQSEREKGTQPEKNLNAETQTNTGGEIRIKEEKGQHSIILNESFKTWYKETHKVCGTGTITPVPLISPDDIKKEPDDLEPLDVDFVDLTDDLYTRASIENINIELEQKPVVNDRFQNWLEVSKEVVQIKGTPPSPPSPEIITLD